MKTPRRPILILVACASAGCRSITPTETLAPDPHSMLTLCQRVVAGDQSARPQLAQHPLVRKMAEGMKNEVGFTPEQFADAAFSDAPDERFSFDSLRTNARAVDALVEHIAKNRTDLIERAFRRASELVSTTVRATEVSVNFVCGGPWDAYVLIFDAPELFFDVGMLADSDLEQAKTNFEAILTHELWHFAFLDHQARRWPVQYRQSNDPAALFLSRMLNEGVGHYYSMRHKLTPKLAYDDFEERQRAVFSLLAQNYPAYRSQTDEAARSKLLWHSHAGVPFWEKWGAVPGALVIHHLVTALGGAAVKALIELEPFTVFLRYDELCQTAHSCPRLPEQLRHEARGLLEEHHRLPHLP